MRKFIAAFMAASMLVTLTACGGGDTSTSTDLTSAPVADNTPDEDNSSVAEDISSADTTTAAYTEPAEPAEPEIDYSSLSEQEIYDLMVERSLMTLGDTTRMSNVLAKAESGEEITAAFIGGSITEGYHDNLTLAEDQKWAKMTCSWLSEQYPSATVNYVNAGLSGTPSILGDMRLERDVLSYEPDIVFVEFAVNDGNAAEYKNHYESLLRTLLEDERDIAVVLLFTIVESGHTCQPHMTQIGENYDLPMISLPDSMWVEIEAGRMTWDDYSGDQSHPHIEGSKIVRDFIVNYFEELIAAGISTGDVDNALPEAVFSDDYMDLHFLESTNLEVETDGFVEYETYHWFKNGWFYKGDKGASLKFTADCSKLAMVFKANNSQVYGTAQIFIDGELVNTVSSNMPSGWNNPETQYLLDSNESGTHEFEIVVESGTPCCFYIMGFAYKE